MQLTCVRQFSDECGLENFTQSVCRQAMVWKMRNANNDGAQDARRWSTSCAIENLLPIVTPSVLISSILGMVGTAGKGITAARQI